MTVSRLFNVRGCLTDFFDQFNFYLFNQYCIVSHNWVERIRQLMQGLFGQFKAVIYKLHLKQKLCGLFVGNMS